MDANDLANLMPVILGRTLIKLREMAIMPRLVNSDFSQEFAQKGDTIDMHVHGDAEISDVEPSNIPPPVEGKKINKVSVKLEHWKKTNFKLTDLDMQRIQRDQAFLPISAEDAIVALADYINMTVHQTYVDSYTYAGDPAFTPFDTRNSGPGVRSATDLYARMQRNLFPREGRRAVLDFAAEAEALALPQFSDAEKVMSAQTKIQGEIGRKFGIDWMADNAVMTHTAGTLADGTVSGAHLAGVTAITVASTDGGTLKKGDIIDIANHTGSYVVTADATVGAAGNAAVSIYPALRANVAGGNAISVLDTHVVNLGFHRDAIALAMRPLTDVVSGLPGNGLSLTMTDTQTGIPLRLEVRREYKQVVWEYDILWGTKMVRPELAIRLPGAPNTI